MRAVLTLGEGYYNEGLSIYKSKSGGPPKPPNPTQAEKDKSKENLKASLAVWQSVTKAADAGSIQADYAMTAEYFHYAGTCYRLLGEYEKAIEYYKKVIAQWPNYSAAGGVAGIIPTVYERMKAEGLISGEAADKLIIDAYQQIIDKYPDSSAVRAAKNRIQYYQSQAERAKKSGSRNVRPSALVNSLSTRGGAK